MNIDALIAFSQRHPWKPHYPKALVRRFLTDLISTPKLVFDYEDSQGRLATAVLLDQVNNPSNDACLEILGMRPDVDPQECFLRFLALAREYTPNHRSGFQVGLTEDSPIKEAVLIRAGLRHHYDTFLMRRSDLSQHKAQSRPEISKATQLDRDEIYRILCESFSRNPDTSIPQEAAWKSEFLRSPASHFYVWRDSDAILGFAHLKEEESGDAVEVSTLGVLPGVRRQGIGQHLLGHCLSEAARLGFNTCDLTVAAANHGALGLYIGCGFQAIEKHRCFRFSR